MSRKNDVSVHEDKYRVVNGERTTLYKKCVYCGLPAPTRDHVPPISRVADYQCLGLKREVYIKVPCCQQCNSILGNTLQDTFLDRVEYLKDRLVSKYRSKIKSIEWDDDEIEELGSTLRSYVSVETRKSQTIRDRVDYYVGADLVLDELEDV